eukprot:6184440-Pleurochrysis_carterae.AAC.1
MIRFEGTYGRENPQRGVPFMHGDRGVGGPAIGWVLEDVLRPCVAGRRRSRTVRLTSSFDSRSSRAWRSGTSGSPMTLSRSRTGGGPPSPAEGAAKKRETVNVEHGGDASTADVVEEIVGSTAPSVRIVIHGVGGVAEAGKERCDTVPTMYGTGEEEERSSEASCSGRIR